MASYQMTQCCIRKTTGDADNSLSIAHPSIGPETEAWRADSKPMPMHLGDILKGQLLSVKLTLLELVKEH